MAQSRLEEAASGDKALLAGTQQRAQDLLDGYISNIGAAVGKDYTIKWVYVDGGNSTAGPKAEAAPEAAQ